MAIDAVGILNSAVSYAMSSGLFARVNGAEPESDPGSEITCAVWIDGIAPVPAESGLASTTARVVLKQWIYAPLLPGVREQVEPAVLEAAEHLISVYSAGFSWGGTVKRVDLLGTAGIALSAQAGYVPIDGLLRRIMDITVPLIINDLWSQSS